MIPGINRLSLAFASVTPPALSQQVKKLEKEWALKQRVVLNIIQHGQPFTRI